jgi:hypothetical protein
MFFRESSAAVILNSINNDTEQQMVCRENSLYDAICRQLIEKLI